MIRRSIREWVMMHRHVVLLMSGAVGWQLAGYRPADAAETCWTMGPAQFAEGIAFCASSSLDPIGELSYGPRGLADGNPGTAWCAPAAKSSDPIWIELRIDRGSEFRRLLVQNGYGKSAEAYRNNSRPKTIDISTDAGPVERIVLPDRHDMLAVQLPSVGKYQVVHIGIVDVYPGEKYSDICLDYVAPDFEYEETLLHATPTPGPSTAPSGTPSNPSGRPDPFGDLGFPGGMNLAPKTR